MEIVVDALQKVPELIRLIEQAIDQQLRTLEAAGNEFEALRDADHEF
jgi:hypothetical protein